jgi:hypothetical protein
MQPPFIKAINFLTGGVNLESLILMQLIFRRGERLWINMCSLCTNLLIFYIHVYRTRSRQEGPDQGTRERRRTSPWTREGTRPLPTPRRMTPPGSALWPTGRLFYPFQQVLIPVDFVVPFSFRDDFYLVSGPYCDD